MTNSLGLITFIYAMQKSLESISIKTTQTQIKGELKAHVTLISYVLIYETKIVQFISIFSSLGIPNIYSINTWKIIDYLTSIYNPNFEI
jgi:hypothetical protein